MDEKIPVIVYIVGAGRSGSTLLDMILGAHSQIFSLGEITHFSSYVASNSFCACRQPVRNCVIWEEVIDRLCEVFSIEHISNIKERFSLNVSKANKTAFDKITILTKLLITYILKDPVLLKWGMHLSANTSGVDKVFSFYDIVSRVSRSPVLVDSSKGVRRVKILCFERPDVPYRVIHLVRDGRGVVLSAMKKTYSSEIPVIEDSEIKSGKKDYVAPQPKTALQASKTWLKTNLVTLFILRSLPKRNWLRIRYEDLCTDPAGELKRICRFIGISYEEQILDFRSAEHHNIGGNPSRWRKDGIRKPSRSWLKSMSESDMKTFERTAGWLNRYFGYR